MSFCSTEKTEDINTEVDGEADELVAEDVLLTVLGASLVAAAMLALRVPEGSLRSGTYPYKPESGEPQRSSG